jgi:hypothetical protein
MDEVGSISERRYRPRALAVRAADVHQKRRAGLMQRIDLQVEKGRFQKMREAAPRSRCRYLAASSILARER